MEIEPVCTRFSLPKDIWIIIFTGVGTLRQLLRYRTTSKFYQTEVLDGKAFFKQVHVGKGLWTVGDIALQYPTCLGLTGYEHCIPDKQIHLVDRGSPELDDLRSRAHMVTVLLGAANEEPLSIADKYPQAVFIEAAAGAFMYIEESSLLPNHEFALISWGEGFDLMHVPSEVLEGAVRLHCLSRDPSQEVRLDASVRRLLATMDDLQSFKGDLMGKIEWKDLLDLDFWPRLTYIDFIRVPSPDLVPMLHKLQDARHLKYLVVEVGDDALYEQPDNWTVFGAEEFYGWVVDHLVLNVNANLHQNALVRKDMENFWKAKLKPHAVKVTVNVVGYQTIGYDLWMGVRYWGQ